MTDFDSYVSEFDAHSVRRDELLASVRAADAVFMREHPVHALATRIGRLLVAIVVLATFFEAASGNTVGLGGLLFVVLGTPSLVETVREIVRRWT